MNQLLIAGAVVAALLAAYKINNAAVKSIAVQNERASVEQKATKKDAIAQTARAAAAKPDSVLQKYCRDCGKSGAVQIVEADDGIKAGPPDKTDGRGNRSR